MNKSGSTTDSSWSALKWCLKWWRIAPVVLLLSRPNVLENLKSATSDTDIALATIGIPISIGASSTVLESNIGSDESNLPSGESSDNDIDGDESNFKNDQSKDESVDGDEAHFVDEQFSHTNTDGNESKIVGGKSNDTTIYGHEVNVVNEQLDHTSIDGDESEDGKSNEARIDRTESSLIDEQLNDTVAEEESTIASSPIPRRLIFTFQANLLTRRNPAHLHTNVHRTVQFYADAWGQNKSDVDVLFLIDSNCVSLLQQVEPRVVPIFQGEKLGSYKADMCRLAALHVHGGYYLDVDIEPVNALDPKPDADFITAQTPNGLFFQAIMATPAGHPILNGTGI